MTISSVSSTNSFAVQLKANGLSASTVKLVENDLTVAEKASAFASGSTTATISSATVRAALNTKIDADVSSGKISASDAAAVKKTLDKIDSQSGAATSASQATPAAGGTAASAPAKAGKAGGGGHGGGGGSSGKTELSETITVSGTTKTTTIIYSDNTTETTTTTATAADMAEYAEPAASDTANNVAKTYLSTIEPGSLINQAG
mgnify:CR=1 FL=1